MTCPLLHTPALGTSQVDTLFYLIACKIVNGPLDLEIWMRS